MSRLACKTDADRIALLTARLEEAHEENRQLKELLAPEIWFDLPLKKQCLKVLRALYAHSARLLSKDVLMAAAPPPNNGEDERDPKIIDAHIYHIRRALAPHGVAIVTHHGVGFSLPASEKAKLERFVMRSECEART